jgi:hypothetical protein
MPRLAILFFLTLSVFAARTPAGSGLVHLAGDLLSSDPPAGSSAAAGPEAPSEPSPDSGWEMDPNG